jgi:hypothetical protein
MAQGREYSKYQRGVINRYYKHQDTLMIQKLQEIVSELALADDPGKTGRLWGSAHKALLKTPVDKKFVAEVIMRRDVEELARLVSDIAGGGDGKSLSAKAAATRTDADSSAAAVTDADMKAAMRAFRKRLKLMRLEDESKINVSPLTGGKKSEIDAIQPPHDFPAAVWQELVKRGELKDAGQGFYALPD